MTVLTIVPSHSSLVDGQPAEVNGSTSTITHSRHSKSSLAEGNSITKEVYELINRRGEIFLTSTEVEGIYAIRVVSANPRAEEKYIRKAFEIIVNATEEVRKRV
jgi:aromatic-L-amino-acid decarboxylase